jgi:hypothetical protein
LGDRKSYIYKTDNYGESWQLLSTGSNGIPKEYPARVVREDPEKEGLLFAGTEYGLFVSFDDGDSWKEFQQNLPLTPITDIKIHRDDLVLSTMGRGFWILDDINVLRQENLNQIKEDFLFKPNTAIRYRSPSGARTSEYPKYPKAAVSIDYFLREDVNTPFKLEILNDDQELVNTYISDTTELSKDTVKRNMSTEFLNYQVSDKLKAKKGYNRFKWDMTATGPWNKKAGNRYKNGPLVKPGTYTAKLTINDKVLLQSFEIMIDPRVVETGISEEIINKQVDFQLKIRDLLNKALLLVDELEEEQKSLENKEITTAAEKSKLAQMEKVLYKLKTREGIYEQPMLTSQIYYLYSMMNEADQEIGKDALDRFGELENEFNSISLSKI